MQTLKQELDSLDVGYLVMFFWKVGSAWFLASVIPAIVIVAVYAVMTR